MNKREYNPLNQGYSGITLTTRGYKGKLSTEGATGSMGTAPITLPKIQSAVVKPKENNRDSQSMKPKQTMNGIKL